MAKGNEKKALIAIMQNPRESYRQLAKKAGMSTATFIQHVRELEAKGIIKGYRALLDAGKLGYGITAVIEVQAKRSAFFGTEEKVSGLLNVCAIYEVTGPYDFLLIARFKDREDLSTFVRKLLSAESIERVHTRIVMSTVREDFSPQDCPI